MGEMVLLIPVTLIRAHKVVVVRAPSTIKAGSTVVSIAGDIYLMVRWSLVSFTNEASMV